MAGSWSRAYQHLPLFLEALLTAAVVTVEITIGGFILAVIFGLIFALFRTSTVRLLRGIAIAYVQVFRSVPVLTQLFIIYFGLGEFGIRLNPLTAAILGELDRAGLLNKDVHSVHSPTLAGWLSDWDVRSGAATAEAIEVSFSKPIT